MTQHEKFFHDYTKEKGVRVKDYISRKEYTFRVGTLQEAIHRVLGERDVLFNGNDGIEGVLVAGSYGRSYAAFSDRVWVHRASPKTKASDVDIVPLLSGDRSAFQYFDQEAYMKKTDEAAAKGDLDAVEANLLHPWLGFPFALQQELIQRSFPVEVHCFEDLTLSKPPEYLQKQLGNNPTDRNHLIKGAGLLFIAKTSPLQAKIISVFQQGNLPVVLDPASTARIIKFR